MEDSTCVTVVEFAKIMSIGSGFIRRLCKVEGFPSVKVGRKNVIYKDKAIEWILQHKKEISNV